MECEGYLLGWVVGLVGCLCDVGGVECDVGGGYLFGCDEEGFGYLECVSVGADGGAGLGVFHCGC